MSRAPQAKALPQAPEFEPAHLDQFSLRAMVDRLFSVAGPKLAEADLMAIVRGGAEFTELAAGNAAHVAEGLGCLVAADDDKQRGGQFGSFQDGEGVARLLWHMQAQWQTVEAVSAAIGWAAEELQARHKP